MANDLTALAPSRALALPTETVDRLTRHLHGRLDTIPGNRDRFALSARVAPSAEQRAILAGRVAEIDAWLVPAPRAAIVRAVSTLRTVLASAASGEDSDDLPEKLYLAALAPFPRSVIEEAAARFNDGRAGDRVYMPAPATFAQLCRDLVYGARTERSRIKTILEAQVERVVTQAERDAALAAVRGAPQTMRLGPTVSNSADLMRARAEAAEAETREAAERLAGSADRTKLAELNARLDAKRAPARAGA